MTEPPFYSTLVLFGKEQARSVASIDMFQQLVNSLGAFLQIASCPLKCRGLIEDEQGRNIAPRKGVVSTKMVNGWKEQLASGTFKQFEIFDAAWSDNYFPAIYAGINKLWGYSTRGYSERTKHGAENNVTVAVRRDIITSRIEYLEDYAIELALMTSSFYGFIELEAQWDRAETPGGLRQDMIDMRWYNRTSGDYKRGKYRMDEMIPRLYWGNVLSSSHFRDGDPNSLPSSMVSRAEAWDQGLYYVRFAKDPLSDMDFHKALVPYFNFIPA